MISGPAMIAMLEGEFCWVQSSRLESSNIEVDAEEILCAAKNDVELARVEVRKERGPRIDSKR